MSIAQCWHAAFSGVNSVNITAEHDGQTMIKYTSIMTHAMGPPSTDHSVRPGVMPLRLRWGSHAKHLAAAMMRATAVAVSHPRRQAFLSFPADRDYAPLDTCVRFTRISLTWRFETKPAKLTKSTALGFAAFK